MARRLHRAVVAVTGIGTSAAPGTATVVLPKGSTIEVASIAAVANSTGGVDVGWRLVDFSGALTLLEYALDPADPSLSYSSSECRPGPQGASAEVQVWLDAAAVADGAATVVLDYSTED